MTEKYTAKAVFGIAEVTVEDPELLHRVIDVLGLPAEAAARLTASAIHLLHLPILAAEKYGERLVRLIDAAQTQVPPERRIPPMPSVAGPILENVKYLEHGNPLLKMYESLLARAIDRERENEAHPAFPGSIQQLSTDEALLIYALSKGELRRVEHCESYPSFGHNPMPGVRPMLVADGSTWLIDGLLHPQHEQVYLARLMGLGLIGIRPFTSQGPEQRDASDLLFYDVTTIMEVFLSDYGKLFAGACVPADWPAQRTEEKS